MSVERWTLASLLTYRHFVPALVRLGEFARGETPDDHFFLSEIAGIFPCAPIQTDPNRRSARAAGAYQIRRKAGLVRDLIEQTGFLRKKIVEHERVAVANDQQRAVRIRIYCRARFLVADRSDRDFFRLDLFCIGSGKIAKVAFDRGLFPFGCVIFSRLAGEFLVNFLFDRLCRQNTTKSRPMRIGLAKNRAVLAGTVLEKDW